MRGVKKYPPRRQVTVDLTYDLFDEIERIRAELKTETRQEYIVSALRVYNQMHIRAFENGYEGILQRSYREALNDSYRASIRGQETGPSELFKEKSEKTEGQKTADLQPDEEETTGIND